MAETDNKLFTQKVRVQLLPSDSTLHNTICLPFKDVFKGKIRLVATRYEETKLPIYGKAYNVRVVEALVGTWLSRVTEYVLGNAAAAYESTFIGLVEPRIAKALQEHAIVGNGNTPNFPDVYKKGNVPSGYDHTEFNPDTIYEGQRFIFIEPAQDLEFKVPTNVTPITNWDNVWVGIVFGAQAEIGVGGVSSVLGAVVNIGDIVNKKRLGRFGGLRIRGWTLGLGVGYSTGGTIIIFLNYPNFESLNTFDAPKDKSWWAKNWDWDIALGTTLGKSSPKIFKDLYELIRSMQGFKQLKELGTKGDLIRWAVESAIKTIKPGLPNLDEPIILQIPVPIVKFPGANIWFGWKTSEYQVYPAETFLTK